MIKRQNEAIRGRLQRLAGWRPRTTWRSYDFAITDGVSRPLLAPIFYPCTRNVRPLAVFLSRSSFSGRARLSTVGGQYESSVVGLAALTLEEVGGSLAHSGVDVCLGGLDVVVEVVAEDLDMGDVFVAALGSQVTGEENCLVSIDHAGARPFGGRTKSDIADLVLGTLLEARHALQLQGRVVPEEHLGSVLQGQDATTGVDKLLQEHLAENAIGLFAEDGAEDDGDAIGSGLDINGLLFAVVDGHDLASFLDPLGGRLGGVSRCFLGQFGELVEGPLKGGGHGVPLHQGQLHDEFVAGFLLSRKVLQVDQHRKVITGLRSHDVRTIFALQHLLGAVLHELTEAFDLKGDEDLGLGFGGGNVESDAVKVGDDLIDGNGRSSRQARKLSVRDAGEDRRGGGYPEKRSVRREWIRTL